MNTTQSTRQAVAAAAASNISISADESVAYDGGNTSILEDMINSSSTLRKLRNFVRRPSNDSIGDPKGDSHFELTDGLNLSALMSSRSKTLRLGLGKHDKEIDGFLKSILQRQEEIKSVKEAENTEEERKLNYKIQQGLIKIKELDVILGEKIFAARTLKKERILRESASGTPQISTGARPLSYHDTLSDEEMDDEDFELRSVHSVDRDTFITEPKLLLRAKIGRQALDSSSKKRQNDPKTADAPPKKGYKQGDFIGRNIALGPDARYYSAMTEEEMDRVNRLLDEDDEDDSLNQSRGDGSCAPSDTEPPGQPPLSISSGGSRPMSTASSGFMPIPSDLAHLRTIDRLFHNANLESILHDVDLPKTAAQIMSEQECLKIIDQQLEELHNTEPRL
nr:hypothetical protein HK105_006599 [Polyrhizophydium stewartii]